MKRGRVPNHVRVKSYLEVYRDARRNLRRLVLELGQSRDLLNRQDVEDLMFKTWDTPLELHVERVIAKLKEEKGIIE